ncbi:MAG TPA: hypothetical protein PKI93_00020 [Alphaproteobacteria bacterium]|nr:hypothetical protein [Alphaproteobacteria bacterium]HNS43595.1 hypothetical protein [Alphaproteobacteria bacterium]
MIYAPQSGAAQALETPKKPAFLMKSDPNGRIDGSVPVIGASSSDKAAFAQALSNTSSAAPISEDEGASFGFFDFLDIINPLQHIPIVGTIYRHITGDEIGPVAQVLGGAVFGGPVGAATGLASAIVTHETGKDVGDAVAGLFSSDHSGLDGTTIALADLSRTRSPYNG